MATKEISKMKHSKITVDRSLDEYNDLPIFQDKVDKANETLRKVGLPKMDEHVKVLRSAAKRAYEPRDRLIEARDKLIQALDELIEVRVTGGMRREKGKEGGVKQSPSSKTKWPSPNKKS